jgi:serine/threonine protein kinase/tetratricopeptide (TPR) repeat protein
MALRPQFARSVEDAEEEAEWEADAPGLAAPIADLLAEFSSRWQLGETPSIEEYLVRLGPMPTSDAAVLIYRAYCLAEAAGLDPDPADFLQRFPAQGAALEQLFGLHRSLAAPPLPEPGDEVGPFVLLRMLGEGGFARVFLAEQSDLDDRLVVVKVATRVTLEPRLLARARHANIVEVLSHHQSEDGLLQVICMPFLGGATLADLMADWRQRGGRPRSGRALLAALDRAAAPEYPTAGLERPARTMLAPLGYDRAVAWIIARLARALDYAYERGVVHGDVKPSNILLTAAGEPMLLDFNLAAGWRAQGAGDLPGDVGGTLAYMAPERLMALAEPESAVFPGAAQRHRADLYALGIVLLEMLAGPIPAGPGKPARTARDLAVALARSRQGGSDRLIGSCGVRIAPALRSILRRCLAPDPADRYPRASELAEDLDGFRRDAPLAFAPAPPAPWGILRRARRHRLAVATGLLCVAVAGLSAAVMHSVTTASLAQSAQSKLARLWDGADGAAFPYRSSGHWREVDLDRPEDAFQHLAYYHVLDAGDWRGRDEFRALPEPERLELEVWLLEQALRLGRGLGQRSEAPADWRRGLEALERVTQLRPLGPLLTQRRHLRHLLGQADPAPTDRPAAKAVPEPRWMEEYLLGVEAEPLRAEDALVHYRNVLQQRPDSLWGHYRAAAMACRLRDWEAAARYLGHCIAQRPENARLRTQLAGCLIGMLQYDAALDQCHQALLRNPDEASTYVSLAYIRGHLGQSEETQTDLKRHELLTRGLGKLPSWRLRLDLVLSAGFAPLPAVALGGAPGLSQGERAWELAGRILDADPEDGDARTAMAFALQREGQTEKALAEYDQVLAINPDHLLARYNRGKLLYKGHRGEADADFAYLLAHPRFTELVRESAVALEAFSADSAELLEKGMADQAVCVAERGLVYARRLGDAALQGKLHYALARAYAMSATAAPEQLQKAAAHLFIAAQYDRSYLGSQVFWSDGFFGSQRVEIARLIPGIAVPVD